MDDGRRDVDGFVGTLEYDGLTFGGVDLYFPVLSPVLDFVEGVLNGEHGFMVAFGRGQYRRVVSKLSNFAVWGAGKVVDVYVEENRAIYASLRHSSTDGSDGRERRTDLDLKCSCR